MSKDDYPPSVFPSSIPCLWWFLWIEGPKDLGHALLLEPHINSPPGKQAWQGVGRGGGGGDCSSMTMVRFFKLWNSGLYCIVVVFTKEHSIYYQIKAYVTAFRIEKNRSKLYFKLTILKIFRSKKVHKNSNMLNQKYLPKNELICHFKTVTYLLYLNVQSL